jgi:DNA repair protein SbcC/Rad50
VARDGVAALGPPPRLGGDLAGEWKALADWAHAEAPARRQVADDALAGVVALAGRAAAAREALDRRCADAGVSVPRGRSHRDAVVQAQATARARHESLVAQQAEAAKVEASRDDVQSRHDLARSLATHLDAKHFEQWLLGEAVAALAAGATELLHSLSGGHYSLSVDGRGNFVVIDHHNADEVRSARTLSGGETFLASLALALALADRIAAMASGGAARLDAIFLDEGFGTLDPDTLDVVASAVEELGAAGRMVGVVSHVAELAERVPVRFEVARSGNTATVTRVER